MFGVARARLSSQNSLLVAGEHVELVVALAQQEAQVFDLALVLLAQPREVVVLLLQPAAAHFPSPTVPQR